MDIQSAYKEAGTLRGAAAICGTTHKTVKRILEAAERAEAGVVAVKRDRNLRRCPLSAEPTSVTTRSTLISWEMAQAVTLATCLSRSGF